MSWTPEQLAEARVHWAAVKLASGGGVRQGVNFAWACMSASRRALLVAARSGMPVGLIAHCAGLDGRKVADWLAIDLRVAELEPMLPIVEAVTERVPMWRERPSRRLMRRLAKVESALNAV